MAAAEGSGKDNDKDQSIPPITPDTDVVELVAHLDDPEGDPVETLAAMQERLSPWTLGRRGDEGTAILKIRRISPPSMKKDCGELPVDVHAPFDWSQIPLNFGAEGTYYLRLYWGPKRIGQLGLIDFPEWRSKTSIQPAVLPGVPAQPTIPIQAKGNDQHLLLQLIQALTNQQHESNQTVSAALEANTKAILAIANGKLNQPTQKTESIFDELDKFSDVASKLKKFQKAMGGLGGEAVADESQWVGLAREAMEEYGEDTIAGLFALIASFRKDGSAPSTEAKPEQVNGTVTVMEIAKDAEGNGE